MSNNSRADADTQTYEPVGDDTPTLRAKRLEQVFIHENLRLLSKDRMSLYPSLSSAVTLELGAPQNRCLLVSTERFAEVTRVGAAYVIYQPDVYTKTGREAGFVTLGSNPDEKVVLGRSLSPEGFRFSNLASREHCTVAIGPDGYLDIEDHSTNGTVVRMSAADVVDPPRTAGATISGSP